MTFLLALLIFSPPNALAQQTLVSLKVSSGSPVLAMPLEIEASVTNPQGGRTTLDLAASTTDSFAIAEVTQIPSQDKNSPVQNFQLRILPLNVGKIPIILFWKTKTPSGSFETQSPPLLIDVAERPLKNLKIYDIASPFAARILLWPWILAVLLIALSIWAYLKFRKDSILPDSHPVILDSRPPHLIAQEEIELLKASNLWKEARYREFYFELSEILKRYFERRFNFPATKMTTSEIHRRLKRAELDVPTIARFKNLFDRADLVKFAKVSPEAIWNDLDVENALALINATRPQETAGTSTPEANVA